MSTTIDSLDIQITTSAGQAERKIDGLATALGRLKENGKITVATNGLKKLAEALNSLNPALNALNAAKLQHLRGAIVGLSNIQKLSGLDSAVRTLKKIPDIVAGLNTADLDRFATKMERLAEALDPLAKKIDLIGNGFSKLPNSVSKAVTATNRLAKETERAAAASTKHSKAINGQSLNLFTMVQNIESVLHVAQFAWDSVAGVMAQAMEWDGIQYRFGRAFGEDAEEVYAYAQKINDVLGINIQQFMQYSSLYGSLLSGFGLAQEKVTTISVGLTELSYDIWAAYNDRFKSLEDASEAVRSAITGEIEPIRNAGIALTEASLQEYLDGIGMAHVSIEKLSEAQKAEVRYAAMMDAAMKQGIVGTYAAEMQTAEGAVRNLSQSFKGLTQAFGSLFIPILQAAIPYLTAFINLLIEAVHWVANLFGITLFKIDWGSDLASGMKDAAAGAGGVASGLGGAADAAKKIKDYTMGFDELNVIEPPTESGGGGGGGGAGGGVDWEGLDLETMWDESVFAKATKQVEELKQTVKDWFEEWKTEIAIIAGALAVLGVANLLENLGEALGLSEKFLTSIKEIKKIATVAIVLTIQYALMSEFLENFIEEGEWEDFVWAAIVGALGAFGSYLIWGKKGLVLSLTVSALVSLEATFEDGKVDSAEEVVTGLTGLAAAAGAVKIAWPTLKPIFVGIIEFFKAAAQMAPEVGWFAALFPKLSGALSAVVGWISSAASAVGGFLAGITAPAWAIIAAVIAAIASVALFLARNWEKVVKVTKEFFKENIAPKLENIKGHFEKMVEAVSPVADKLKDVGVWAGNLAEKFAEWWKAAQPLRAVLSGVLDVLERFGGIIFGLISGVLAGLFNAIVSTFENVVRVFSGIIQVVSGLIDFVMALFSGGDIEAAWQKIWDGVVDVAGGLWHLIIDPISSFVTGIIDWFVKLWDELVGHSIVPDTIDAIVEWFCSLPEKIFGPVQEFVDGIIKKFKDMWDNIKQWYNTNVAPKFTRAYWQNVFDKVVSGVSSKLSELKGKIAEKWQTVVDWYNESVAPKLKLSYWTDKISSFLDVGREIVENIKEGLKEKWEELKKWWEELELPEFKIKMPHISWESTPASGWIAETLEALGLPTSLPKMKVEWYAQGGLPSMGELFVAREAGPELVGRIGSKNAVVNNDQIVAAVSQGVYSAVVAAMGSASGGNQAVNVYLDGKQIYSSVKKTEAERGVSIMGNQLGYAY